MKFEKKILRMNKKIEACNLRSRKFVKLVHTLDGSNSSDSCSNNDDGANSLNTSNNNGVCLLSKLLQPLLTAGASAAHATITIYDSAYNNADNDTYFETCDGGSKLVVTLFSFS